MAKSYDIVARLQERNEKPFVKLAEDKVFTIDTEYKNVMAIMAMTQELDSDDNVDNQMLGYEKLVSMALGKDAWKYIMDSGMTFDSIQLIVEAIFAGIEGTELGEVKKVKK